MQIVIEISDSDKEIIDNGFKSSEVSVNFYRRLITAIQEGTPLPKGHGRLIDADELKERIRRSLAIKSFDYLLPAEKAIVEQIEHTDTIIPADKE